MKTPRFHGRVVLSTFAVALMGGISSVLLGQQNDAFAFGIFSLIASEMPAWFVPTAFIALIGIASIVAVLDVAHINDPAQALAESMHSEAIRLQRRSGPTCPTSWLGIVVKAWGEVR